MSEKIYEMIKSNIISGKELNDFNKHGKIKILFDNNLKIGLNIANIHFIINDPYIDYLDKSIASGIIPDDANIQDLGYDLDDCFTHSFYTDKFIVEEIKLKKS